MKIPRLRAFVAALLLQGAMLLAAPGAATADDAITATVKTDPALNAMLPKAIRDSGIIKLGTDAHYPPCESFAEDNVTMIGWEPDMWDALAKKLGVKVNPSSIEFAGLLPGVQSGRFDVAMECIADTLERQKKFTFVDLSVSTNGVFTMENTTITTDPLTLCGKKTAVQKGTSFVLTVDEILSPHCVKAGKPAIDKSVFPSADSSLLALFSGRVDFILNDAVALAEMQKKVNRPVRLFMMDVLPRKFNGILMLKENMELANALLAATKALISEGVYDRIMDKWNVGVIKLKTPGINLTGSGVKP